MTYEISSIKFHLKNGIEKKIQAPTSSVDESSSDNQEGEKKVRKLYSYMSWSLIMNPNARISIYRFPQQQKEGSSQKRWNLITKWYFMYVSFVSISAALLLFLPSLLSNLSFSKGVVHFNLIMEMQNGNIVKERFLFLWNCQLQWLAEMNFFSFFLMWHRDIVRELICW